MGPGVKLRRLLVVSVRGCRRSIGSHPFLVSMACFLFLLYRSSPWLFSLLVSASPVLVCTTLLLGMLLSFGQPNVPEIERKEETFSHKIAPLKASTLENASVVARNKDLFPESLTCEKKKEMKERDADKGASLLENSWPVGNTSRDIEFEKPLLSDGVTEYSEGEESNNSVHDKRIGTEGVSGSHEGGEKMYRLTEEEVYDTFEVENDKDRREPSEDHLEILSESQRKEIDEDDVSEDCGSDQAESSSPDASMADIRPMLDELHPLLDEEEPLAAVMTHEHSDIASEHSIGIRSENLESDEDSQNEEAVNDDDADELEEEEEAEGGKDNESKLAITWTEDDQKNLMDMGTSELERNQRLENLIARRGARKNMGLMDEKNLIDLDSNDISFNVPAIATTRPNPFDCSDDSYNSVGLPPIPGSAPSIMLRRRNPFDLPYEPNEEKPDLKRDSFQQDFIVQPQRDAIFRRHESFSTGPSNLGMFRQEKQDVEWRPYFIPEHFTADGRNYHSVQRQSSEVSDSKASSGPDTESLASTTPENFTGNGRNYHPFQRQLSEVSDSKVSSGSDTESVASMTDQRNRNVNEQDSSKEAEAVSSIDRASLSVEHGSEFSEDFDSPGVEEGEKDASLWDENVIMLDNAETRDELESHFSETMNASLDSITYETKEEPESSFSEAMNALLDSNTNEAPLSADTVYVESSSKSSSSFYSEVNDSDLDVKKEENSRPTTDLGIKSHFTNEHEGTDNSFSCPRGTVDDKQPWEPVYDSSPPMIERFHSFSSLPTGMQVHMVETGTSPEVVQNSSDKTDGMSMPKNVPDYNEMFASPSLLHTKNGNGSIKQELTELMEDDMHEASPTLANGEVGNQSGQETSIEPVSTSSTSYPSWDESIVEGALHRQGSHDEHGNVNLLSFDAESFDVSHHPLGDHQEGFISPASLQKSEVSKLERLPSNGIEHATTIDVDLGTKEEGADLETPLSATDVPVQESMELKVDDMQHEKSKLLSDVPSKIHDPFPQDQVDQRDVTTSDQWQTLSEETELSPHEEQKFLPDPEKADDHLNVQQEDIRGECPPHTSDVKEDASLIEAVDLEVVNMPSQQEQSRLEDLQNQETLIVKEESVNEAKGADEDTTLGISESGITSLPDNTTTSPQSVHFSVGTLGFLSPTGAAYYSDDSACGVRSIVHAQVLEQSEQLKDSSESGGNFRVRETIDRSVQVELPLVVDRADGTNFLYSPSEPGESVSNFHDVEAKSIEDITLAFRHIHEGANADAKMVSDSGSIDLDHGDSKTQVEENSDFHEPRHIEVTGFHEETGDDVEEVPQAREHSHGLTMMERANEMSISDSVNTMNEVAAAVTNPEMISYSLSLPVLEVRSFEDINIAFERLWEAANMEEVILPMSIGDETGSGEPQTLEKTISSAEVVELRSLDDMKQLSSDDDQRPDNRHSEDRPADGVASEMKNPGERSDGANAESDSEETRNKAEDSCSNMSVPEAASTGDTGITSEQSNKRADVEESVLSSVNNNPTTGELSRQDRNYCSDVISNDIIHLPENQTVETDRYTLHKEADIADESSAVFKPAGEVAFH